MSARAAKGGYIVGPIYDSLFFLYSPLIALVLGILITHLGIDALSIDVFGEETRASHLFITSLISGHLFIVFFRSHGNGKIFRQFPLRFTLIPVALFALVYCSLWACVAAFVLAIWWDVYHSSLQTFGLGRIYDRLAGNKPSDGRGLDLALNLLLYIGPILGGATLMDHVEYFSEFDRVDSAFFTAVPAYAEGHHRWLTLAVLLVGTPFLVVYVVSATRRARGGAPVSRQKVILYAGTGLCSIYTWGFNSFGQAFFIMNFFHAAQYFALVWWSEGGRLTERSGLARLPGGATLGLLAFLAIGGGYGLTMSVASTPFQGWLFCLGLVISLLHFWYDGFIWSVRRRQV